MKEPAFSSGKLHLPVAELCAIRKLARKKSDGGKLTVLHGRGVADS